MRWHPLRWLSYLALIGGVAGVVAAAEKVDYTQDVKPLLKHCYACHGALRQQSGLRVDTAAWLRKGGDSGAAIVPGKSAESLLLHALTGTNDVTRMPPAEEFGPLAAEAIDKVRAWIDQGAEAPAELEPITPRQHWAYQPPHRPEIPSIRESAWAKNPIDHFVLAEQEQRGLQHAPEAAKNVLLRRVYLDLIGLPPTPDELQAFLADGSQDAYEKVVNRLLESPHYGERWGRHWMDVWRYSDWAGYGAEIRESQYHIWRWRDWIIESLNADKPYDQMIQEMLAGDEIAPSDPNVLRATGYLGRNWFKFNRNVWLDNTVEHVGKAFLGVTFNCARCHDHKYDPFSQAEYYRLRAIFEAYDVRYDRVPGQSDVTKDGVARVFDQHPTDPTYLFVRGNEQTPDKDHPQPAELPEFFGAKYTPTSVPLPVESFYPALAAFQVSETRAQMTAAVAAADNALAKASAALGETKQRLAALALNPTAESQVKPTVFLRDEFNDEQGLWSREGGNWMFQAGRLVQSEIVSAPSLCISRENHPTEFRATLRFKTTGGKTYKSVGLSFDAVDASNYQAVYLSAYDAGPKLQIYHSQQGQIDYPVMGMAPHPVKVGEEQTLAVAVRGQLINVWVNGEFKLAYELPIGRRQGKFSIWTYDATAEFLEVQVESLPVETVLAGAGSKTAPVTSDPVQVKQALEQAVLTGETAQALATKGLAVANAELESFDQRLAAERAKYGLEADGDLKLLARAASQAERQAAMAKAEYQVMEAERSLAAAIAHEKPGNEKSQKATAEIRAKLDPLRTAVETAKKNLATDSEQYAPLGEVHPQASTGRRLALANWIANRENPLTARVAINHIWLRHFGRPLVPTVFDFGMNGKSPSHPQLLDWLATELMEQGWRMKSIHRLVVTSATYRQSSSPADFSTPPTTQQSGDPDNRFLWRMNSRRLEAEIVRDSLLSVAGSLNSTIGGPEMDQDQGQRVLRRSMYFRHAKEKEMLFTKLFDGPGVSECYQRDESVVPQQALALANSPLGKNQSRLLANSLSRQCGMDQVDGFIRAAFERVLTRPPAEDELLLCREFLAAQARLFAEPNRLTAASVGESGTVLAAVDPQQHARENLVHVLLNHHDFVTVR